MFLTTNSNLIDQLEEAQSAILKLNGSNLGGSFIEVRMADHDMDAEEPQSDNLYCKNLPSNYTDMDVRCLFEPFGSVHTCRVLHHGDLTGLGGAALIRLSSVEEATNAIRDLNGHQIPGSYHPLIVKYADNSEAKAKKSATRSLPLPSIVQSQQQGYHPPQRHNPYGSLSAAASAAAAVVVSQQHLLAQHYGGFGGAPAFINTSQYSAAQYPYSNPQQAMVDPLYQSIFPLGSSSSLGHQIAAGPPSPGPQVSLSVASLYIKNLPLDANRLFLYEKFAPYGAILSVKVLYDDHGTSKGIGFVNYATVDSAQKAAAALNNLPVGDRCLQISFQTRRKV
jgi:RNA recognition motif-containing protein